MTVPYPPAVHDFDFLHGHWTIANRRLKTRGVGADDWDVFASTAFRIEAVTAGPSFT